MSPRIHPRASTLRIHMDWPDDHANREVHSAVMDVKSPANIGVKEPLERATLKQICRQSSTRRSYLRQKVDVPGDPRSGERSYAEVALSN